MAQDRDDAIAKMCELTGQDHATAQQYLGANDWNVEAATQSWFEDMEADGDNDADAAQAAPDPRTAPAASSSRQVQPATAAVPSAAPSSSSRPPPKKKFGTFRDLADNGSDGNSHGDDDDSDKEQQYFAGGDKSGLAVQDPSQGSKEHIRRMLETARRGPVPPPDQQAQQSSFRGTGFTLGGEDTPSRRIPDPNADQPPALPMAERTLHLWSDGFSVDDGPLFRYDDPANARTLEMINRGSAPLDLMNVENGQAVDVKLEQHHNEKYVQPKKKYKPFSGAGQRLGSPVPAAVGAGTVGVPAQAATAAPAATTTEASSSSTAATVEGLDESQPLVTLQIRLADGSRLPSRFNTTHSIGDLYSHVQRISPASASRSFSLATTFPTKELTDKEQKIGDLAALKRGGVVVQKWA